MDVLEALYGNSDHLPVLAKFIIDHSQSIICLLYTSYSQDTIKVMSYNLLNYGNYTSYCTTYNNNVETKNEYLRTIIDYTLPDILGVVEISPNGTYIEDFKNNVLNQNGRDYYCNAPKTNYSGSSTINMIYYDYRKVELKHWLALATDYRDINLYTFYFKNDALKNGDTVYPVSYTHLDVYKRQMCTSP